MSSRPEYNVTGIDYTHRHHWIYDGPIVDAHAHVTMTKAGEAASGAAGGSGASGSTEQAERMLDIGRDCGIVQTWTMCPPQDIPPLRERFGDRLVFNGMLNKKPDEPDDAAYQLLDQFMTLGVRIIKLWAAPRGRDRGLTLDPPWRVEGLRRARAAGIRVFMVHVGDPDVWFGRDYADSAKYGTKADQYVPFRRLLEEFPDVQWIAAHMGGDPEHPEHLEAMLERYPHLHYDTSATKWQVREVSPRAEVLRSLISRYPSRFLFGTDLVTRHLLTAEHYLSRYWCQRTLWESSWRGPSPIADPDFSASETQRTPLLCGLGLTLETIRAVYFENANRLIPCSR